MDSTLSRVARLNVRVINEGSVLYTAYCAWLMAAMQSTLHTGGSQGSGGYYDAGDTQGSEGYYDASDSKGGEGYYDAGDAIEGTADRRSAPLTFPPAAV